MNKSKIILLLIAILGVFVSGYKVGLIRKADPNSLSYYFKLGINKIKGENISNEFNDFNLPQLTIKVPEKVKAKLDIKLEDVLTNHEGWMSSEINPPKYHKAKIFFRGEKIPVKIRLKGNTGLNSEYGYSLRVKTKSSKLLGIKSFNLQPPSVKYYEHEWLFHALGKKMGLISIDYLFLKLKNGNKTKLYNLEEHFHENFIKRKKLSKGVIICYEESVETMAYAHNNIAPKGISRESFFIAKVKPYYRKKVLKTPELLTYYNDAKNKLELFRNGLLKTSQVFNIEKLATFFVLCDLGGNVHPTEYRNMKFYYNSQTKLLEPIPYDMRKWLSLTVQAETKNEGIIGEVQQLSPMLRLMFKDSLLNEKYIKLVDYYCKIDIATFFANEFKSLDSIQSIMRINPISDYTQLNLKNITIENQKYMQRKLLPLKISTVSLVNSINDSNQLIKIENLHDLNIQLDSIKLKNGDIIPHDLVINSTPTGKITEKKYIIIKSNLNNIKKFFFHIQGTKNIYSENILQY